MHGEHVAKDLVIDPEIRLGAGCTEYAGSTTRSWGPLLNEHHACAPVTPVRPLGRMRGHWMASLGFCLRQTRLAHVISPSRGSVSVLYIQVSGDPCRRVPAWDCGQSALFLWALVIDPCRFLVAPGKRMSILRSSSFVYTSSTETVLNEDSSMTNSVSIPLMTTTSTVILADCIPLSHCSITKKTLSVQRHG